jgi:hypothetical protein
MSAAARASLRLLAADPDAPARRVVLAADIANVANANGDEPAAVLVAEAIPVTVIASGHADEPGAELDVRAAVRALPAADAGDDDASFAVDGAEGHELLWYATQELTELV